MPHDLDQVLEVVEDEQRVYELEEHLGQAVGVAAGQRQALEVAHGLVADVADGAAVEGGQVGVGDQREAFELALDLVQRVDAGHGLIGDGGSVDAVGLGADEGVARGPVGALDRLEQERVVAALDLEEGGDGRFQVGEDLAIDGRQAALAGHGQAPDLFQ